MENIAPSTLTPRKTVDPARICGVSMLPPKRSGTSEERTSPPAGATPTVPSIGSTRQLDAVVAVPGGEGDGVAVAVELVDPGGVRQRVLQRDDAVGARHAAEERDGRRGAPVARRLQRDEVQHERVAGLGALDVERAGLRVDEAQVDLVAGQVVDAAQRAAERVVGPQPQRGAGLDPHRRGGAAEGEGVLLAGRRVLDDVHVPGTYLRPPTQPNMIAVEVGHPRHAEQRQRAGDLVAPGCRRPAARPRSPPAISP